jgi:carbamoyltransferase
MKAHEDEYKVMGLAPYGERADLVKIIKVFEKLLWVDGLRFSSFIPSRHFDFYLNDNLKRFRFDHVAAAAQKFLEDKLVEWVKNAIAATDIHELSVAGGVFLNVKANQRLFTLKGVRRIFFLPSPGDDTNSFGACYFGFRYLNPHKTPHPLTSLYLGPKYSDQEIYNNYKHYKNYKIFKPKNMALKVAQLLAQGEVIARFSNRMEFGARALGNRSILADPRRRDVVETINRMIKMRDFWMPFAPTILAQDTPKYIKNSKMTLAPYMILAFDTTKQGKKDLAAAIHPHDKTVRPQILKRRVNPTYFDTILEFKHLTGVGALLNTSFNLHGEPIVCSPKDALSTFTRSGLMYLQLENFLISKIS